MSMFAEHAFHERAILVFWSVVMVWSVELNKNATIFKFLVRLDQEVVCLICHLIIVFFLNVLRQNTHAMSNSLYQMYLISPFIEDL